LAHLTPLLPVFYRLFESRQNFVTHRVWGQRALSPRIHAGNHCRISSSPLESPTKAMVCSASFDPAKEAKTTATATNSLARFLTHAGLRLVD